MNEAIENAYAKINLTLDVTGVRPDGYHDVSMIMQSISLHDVITVRRSDKARVSLAFSDTEMIKKINLSGGEDNLIVRAARSFFRYIKNDDQGCDIILEKNIPAEAGMGGGSSDAAATLRALNRLFGQPLSAKELCEIGADIGADVPFCIIGGTALAEGIGEILTPLINNTNADLLLIKPPIGASTKAIYDGLELDGTLAHPDTKRMAAALEAGKLHEVCALLANVMEPVTIGLIPEIGIIKREMLELGAKGALMSGSGSTVFGIFDDKEKLNQAHAHFSKDSGLFVEKASFHNFNALSL